MANRNKNVTNNRVGSPVVPRKKEVGGVKSGQPLRLRDLEFTDLYIAETGKIQIRGAVDNDGRNGCPAWCYY